MNTTTERIRRTARAGPDQAGMRLDQAAAELFDEFSRGRLQKWIRSGELRVDGQQTKPTHRMSGTETLTLDAEPEPDDSVAPQAIPLDVLYADADLIVLDKPAGMVVHPAAGNPDGTLQNALLHWDPSLATLPRGGIVHRLDKDTSGVMVVARSLRAHASLVEQLQSRRMSRVYRALALGDIITGGTVDAPIGRHPRDRKRMAVVASGRPAVTHYRVLERFGFATWLEVSLETGRTHQIRVHMAREGHALVGDPVYGRRGLKTRGVPAGALEAMRSFPRQALHARTLELVHPGTGEVKRFEAPLPADLEHLLAALRGSDS
ncbi:MAG: 23S rRNA pseudouridine(1911/1915/1917) synthase RluD [Lysobacterales bacterium]|jgi:23S rRNA pseudouridine1911/1915/1917 synthase